MFLKSLITRGAWTCFISDVPIEGRRISVFNLTADYNREALTIEAAISFPANRIVITLEIMEEECGLPEHIRVDNKREFISHCLGDWCRQKNIKLEFIQSGKPTQNAYIERFN